MHNLTQSRAQIDHWIKDFSFGDFEDKVWHSRGEFSLFFQRNLDFKHSLDVELSLKEEEMKIQGISCLNNLI